MLGQLLFLISPALVCGQSGAPRFEVHTTDVARVVGVVQKMDVDGAVNLEQQPSTIPGRGIVALRRSGAPLPPWPRAPHCVLSNGDRIVGSPQELSSASLRFKPDLLRDPLGESNAIVHLPATWLSILWLRSPDSIDVDKFPSVFNDKRKVDQTILRNGDIVSGTVIGLDSKKGEIQIESGSEKRSVEMNKVVVIAFSNRFNRSRKPVGPFGHLVLVNGARLTVLAPSIHNDILTARTPFKEAFRVSINHVAALDIYQGPAVYLSDLKPTKYQYRTYQGEEFDWQADRNLASEELALQGREGARLFDKGIAVHGECTLVYDIEKKFRRFECVVGLDPKLGRRGSAAIRILVDGKEHPSSAIKMLTIENGPVPLSVDVAGAKEITLIVNWGEGGNVGDYVNWCDARLIP